MLQNIRDRAQSWIFSLIIGLLVLAFAFWGVESYFSGGRSSQTIAKVEGHEITQNDLNTAYQRLRRQLQLRMGAQFNLTPQIEKNLKRQALQQLIHSYVLRKAAVDNGYSITSGQLDTVLATIPMFQENGQFSAARFQGVLSNLFYSQAAFISQLQSDMLINQLQIGMVNTAFVLPSDVDTAYKLINQTRNIKYVKIPVSRFKKDIKISETAQRSFYAQNKDKFRTPEQVSVKYIELNMQAIQSKQKFTEAELKQYYEGNKANYTTPARWHVAQILIRIPPNADKNAMEQTRAKVAQVEKALNSGKSFDEVAKQYSEDIATKNKGGVMPWFSQGMIGPGFEKAVAQLKTGEVSKPVRTKFGFNIIKLLEKKPSQVQPFSKVKLQIKNTLAQQQAQKLFATENDRLSNLTFSDSGSLQSAAKSLGLEIKSSPLFARKGTKTGITANPKVINAAFSNTVLMQHYNSDPIQISDGQIIVLRLKQHEPATVKPFAEVQAEIKTLLAQKAAAAKAQQLGQKLISIIKQQPDTTSLQQMAKQNKLHIQVRDNVRRHDTKLNANILNAAFTLPKPRASQKSLVGITMPNGDYSIVELTKVTNGDVKHMSAEARKAFQAQLAKGLGLMDYNLYVHQKIKNAKVELKQKINS